MFKINLIILSTLVCVYSETVNAKATERIINGKPAWSVLPHHAHLIIRNTSNPDALPRVGSGCMITTTAVLTVAQNIRNFNDWSVGVGSLYLNDLEWQTTSIGFSHQDYNHMTLANNIAVIRLFRPFDSTIIVPIALPIDNADVPRENEYGAISGFGWTSNQGSFSDILQLSHQRVVDQFTCNGIYNHLAASIADLFCAFDETDLSSMCGGDQGSAYTLNVRGVNTVVGLASTTRFPDCAQSAPNLYMRVSSYIPWIQFIAGIWE